MVKPPAGRVGPVPGEDPAVGFEDLSRGQVQLHRERLQTGSGDLGNSTILIVTNGLQQLLHAIAADLGHNPELC